MRELNMENNNFTKEFGLRLRDAMITAGYGSQRSISGVCIEKLAEITGYSVQICRRYLRGEAIPEPSKLAELAKQLNVSPGWLLFGLDQSNNAAPEPRVIINKKLLHYVLLQAADLFSLHQQREEVTGFIMDLIQNLSQIDASEEQSKKIIQLTLDSVNRFKKPASCTLDEL